ncbi:MAG: ABC transporter ATP-binding protein [Clostridia bacterium]|nr:ABC transporter ATP-binding protein [Clostridia bacterium]MBP3582972.1 ABC transporter ATP-binding protein [Clostridia bacterium]
MKNRKTLTRVLKYIGRYKYLLPLSLLMALISTALTLYVPILIGEAIDAAVGAGRVDFAIITDRLLLSVLLIGITALATWIMSAINNRIAYRVSEDIRNEAFVKIESLPLSYIDTTPHGEIVNRIINDTDRFAEGLLLGFTQVFTGVLTIVGTLVFMLVLCWQIALVVVLLTPLSIFIAKFIGTRTFNMFKARSECEAKAASLIDEMLTGQKTVRAFGYENRATERFDEVSGRLERTTLDAIFFSSLTNPTTRFVNSMVYAATALVGALIVIASGGDGALLTIGEFSVLLSYTNQYTKPFNEISGIFAEFQNALASAGRVLDLIEEPSEQSDEGFAEVKDSEGNISISDVSFSYSKEKPLIEGLNLDVKKGQTVAIVGPTGCGKTTFINLLMRFYDVDSGKIELDGKDIRTLTRHSLRTSYGMVLQDTWLFSGTVRENIAFSRPEATDEEIVAAARAAHAHSFIKRLEGGYDTHLGEGGEGLSQGQKQLICIARVMLCLPPMLILDEATSSIDTRTEMRIQRAFSEMTEGRTSFIVAHRLSTVRDADVILVMRDGKIVESGTHEDLLLKGGFYSELYNSQFAH